MHQIAACQKIKLVETTSVRLLLISGVLFCGTLAARPVYLEYIGPARGNPEPATESKLRQSLFQALEASGFQSAGSRAGADFSVQVFYRRRKALALYCEIYAGAGLIDAFTISADYEELGDITLPADEFQSDDNSAMSDFVETLVRRLKSNPGRKIRSDNLQEYALSSEDPERIRKNIQSMDKSSAEVFQMLEDQIVVTATRGRIRRREAPAAVYVITAKEIRERGYRTVADALHDVPGFDIIHVYGIFPDLIHQRGLVGNNQRTLFYVDGIPDNNITENAFLAGSTRFPLHNVERIEIISGPASALYGANAFNGIVNVITGDGSGPDATRAEIFYGGYEPDGKNPGKGFSLTTGGSLSNDLFPFSYNASAYYYQTQGPYFGDYRRLERPVKNSDEAIRRRNDAEYFTESELCKGECKPDENSVGYYWSPRFNVAYEDTYNITGRFQAGNLRFQTINWQYLQGDGTFANGTQQIDVKERGLETEKYDLRNNARRLAIANGQAGARGFVGSAWDFRNNSLMLGYLTEFGEKLNLDSELIVRHTEILSSSREEYPDKPGPYAYLTPGAEHNTTASSYSRPDYQYQINEKLGWQLRRSIDATLGMELVYTEVPQGYGSFRRFTYKNYAFYGQLLLKPLDRLHLTGGYRQDKNSIYGTSHTPRLGLVFIPTKDLTFKILLGTGFRAPTAWELFNETQQRRANTGLKPEKLRSAEAGAGYRLLNRYYFSVTSFYNEIDDLILEVQTPEPQKEKPAEKFNQNQNVGEAVVYGAESEAVFEILPSLKVNLHHTYSRGNYVNLPGPQALQASPSTRGRPGDDPLADAFVSEYRKWADSHLLEDVYLQSIDREFEPFTGPIPNIPAHKGGVGVTLYPASDFSLHVRHNYVDVRRTIGTNPKNSTHGYHWFHASARWENAFLPGLYLQLTVRNMGDARAFDPGIRTATGSYYPTEHPLENRNVWFTMGYKF